MSRKATDQVTTIGIDIGKNSFHLIGLDAEGNIVLRRKLSHGRVVVRLANLPPCLIGMEACVGAHHLSRRLVALGHDARIIPAHYVKPYLRGQKNDFGDAEAIAEAVQRPRMRFVPTKSVEQLDLQAMHRVRSRLIEPLSSTRSVPCSWSVALPCDKALASCAPPCRTFWAGTQSFSRRAWSG